MQSYPTYFRSVSFAAIAVATHSILTDVVSAQSLQFPEVTARTVMSQYTILPGESVNINVRINGSTRVQSEPVPAGIVFVLDYSGSMSAHIETLRAATSHIIAQLDPAHHKVGAVAFASDVTLLSQPTSQFSQVISAIDKFSVQGYTNIAGGFLKATHELRDIQLPLRFGILFTDGRPEPPRTANQQRNTIDAELSRLRLEPFTFHTIGLGDVDRLLLDVIARRTGGTFVHIENASDIQGAFDKIYQENSATLTTKAVQITESVSSRLRVDDGSYLSSVIPPSVDGISFQDEIQQKVQSFYQTSKMEFPVIAEMGSGRFFAYSFDVTVDFCNETRDITIPLRSTESSITFSNGEETPKSMAFDNASVTIKRCGVYASKTWDEARRLLGITIHNALGRPIREIYVRERLCNTFDVDWTRTNEFDPFPTDYDAAYHSPKWNVAIILHGEKTELSFPIKENNASTAGEEPIQCDDFWTQWILEKPAFRILESEPIYRHFRQELRPSTILSGAVLSHISNKFGHAGFNAATVGLSPQEVRDQGYPWSIKVDGLEGSPVGGASGLQGSEAMTGLLYVKKLDDGYELISEVIHREQLPELYTSPDFIPSP